MCVRAGVVNVNALIILHRHPTDADVDENPQSPNETHTALDIFPMYSASARRMKGGPLIQ